MANDVFQDHFSATDIFAKVLGARLMCQDMRVTVAGYFMPFLYALPQQITVSFRNPSKPEKRCTNILSSQEVQQPFHILFDP
jgi:hypothetical protein